MTIVIRPIETNDEYRAVEALQRAVWQAEDIEIIPHDLLLTAHKNGGLVLGAYVELSAEKPELIGFTFGFIGLTDAGVVKFCSHIAGVAAAYRDRNVGYLLKTEQRMRVLAKGLQLVTWTFDPLESRNAKFNFHKLGVTCNTFLPNLYGEMRDGLNAGLPSDRFQVDWHLNSPQVVACLAGQQAVLRPSALLAAGVPLLNPARSNGLLQPATSFALPQGEPSLLVQIPANFQSIKAQDFGLASAWRAQAREVFSQAFASGYTAVDVLSEEGRIFYLLEMRGDTAHAGLQM